MYPDVKFRQIRAFIAVAEWRSFTKASAALHISQPALTASIRQLEETLATRLLDRNTRSVTLTESGESFFATAKYLVRSFDSFIGDTRDKGNLQAGQVVVSALPSVSATLVRDSIPKFRRMFPGVSLHLYDGIDLDVAGHVVRMQADFGVGGRLTRYPELDFEPLAVEKAFVVFRRGHWLAQRKKVAVAELADEPMIVQSRRTRWQQLVEEAFVKSDVRTNTLCEVQQLSSLKSFIETGLGVAIVNSTCLPVVVGAGILAREVASPPITREIGIITRAGGSMSVAAESFRQIIHAALTHAGAGPAQSADAARPA
ncbi:LysR family transcriptional regulator [Pigmentiphaga soli]|uniref:LysR family transcriptional regulator n=1 Tax=Pigmentiphaga soli TaxID=1007095 RepID=A0ABP8H4J8_9BURK